MPQTGSTTDEPDDIETWIHGLREPIADETPADDQTEPATDPGAQQQ